MSSKTLFHASMPEDIKEEAASGLTKMGLTGSDAIPTKESKIRRKPYGSV